LVVASGRREVVALVAPGYSDAGTVMEPVGSMVLLPAGTPVLTTTAELWVITVVG
jgi:hypothetical protein